MTKTLEETKKTMTAEHKQTDDQLKAELAKTKTSMTAAHKATQDELAQTKKDMEGAHAQTILPEMSTCNRSPCLQLQSSSRGLGCKLW